MKKNTLIYLTLCATQLMSSCEKELTDFEDQGVRFEYEAIKSELDIDESSFSVDGSEQTLTVQISCNSYWTAEKKSSWLYPYSYSGKGNGTLTLKVDANPSTTAGRKDEINVTDGIKTIPITVSQSPAKEKITVSAHSLSFNYGADHSYVSVTANTEWTVRSDANWCKAE